MNYKIIRNLNKKQQEERKRHIFFEFTKREELQENKKRGYLNKIAEELAIEYDYKKESILNIYYDGKNGKLDKYKTTYKKTNHERTNKYN